MKKIFTLMILFCLVSTMQARTWDFRNWSTATWNMLKASAAASSSEGWSDVEKAGGEATEISKDNCFWQATIEKDADGNLLCDGEIIPELKGLYYTNTATRSLAIACNYPYALNDYAGAAYLWLGSKTKNYFIIPNVKPGTHIKMGVESHKNSDARGVRLYLTHGKTASSSGTEVTDAEGNAPSMPKEYTEFEWVVPETASDEANEDGTWDIQIYNTNGCHIYYIDVEETVETAQVGYLFNGTMSESLFAKASEIEGYEIVPIDIAGERPAAETLQEYHALIIDPLIPAADAEFLKGILPWQPVVNFNANLYAPWGYGEKVEGVESEVAVIKENLASLFADVIINEDDESKMFTVTNGDAMPVAVKLTGNFADDVVYAVELEQEENIFMHGHNVNHNGYFYMPYDDAAATDLCEDSYAIIANAVKTAANSKSKVVAAPAPAINVEHGKLNATFTVSSNLKNSKFYYTLDGTDPTEESTLFTEAVTVTDLTIVKAVSISEGYLLSEVTTDTIFIFDQAQSPLITVNEQGNGLPTIITMSTDEVAGVEGDSIVIWYNFSGENSTDVSTQYTEPLSFQTANQKKIYAFAVAGNLVASVPASADFKANTGANLRRNILTHMDADYTDWNAGSTSTSYYFSWGKTAQSMYNEDIDSITGEIIKTLKEPETFRAGTDDGEGGKTYVNEYNADWQLKSYGQVMDWMKASPAYSLHNGGDYNSWKVEDQLQEYKELNGKNVIQFGGKTSGESANASIETIKPFKGPFNVLFFLGNGTKPGDDGIYTTTSHTFEIAVATDTTSVENWVAIDSVTTPNVGRNWTMIERPYNGTDEVFVRIKQVAGGSSAYIITTYLMGPGGGTDVVLGDANGDGNIDVADITAIAAKILGNTPEGFNADNADANQDGNIDVADITATAAIILGN